MFFGDYALRFYCVFKDNWNNLRGPFGPSKPGMRSRRKNDAAPAPELFFS